MSVLNPLMPKRAVWRGPYYYMPFQIIADKSYLGQSVGKYGQQNNFVFTNIRYIIQNGNIVPIGFLIQNNQVDILRLIFMDIFSNGQKYFKKDVSPLDLMSFQNIGVKKSLNFKVEDLLKALFSTLDEFYTSEQDPSYDEGYEIGLLFKNIGFAYQNFPQLETKFKGAIFFVKNNDNKCLYASIISAFIKKSIVADKKHIFKLGEYNYTVPILAFSENRQMQSYADKPRIQNLFFFTQLFIYLINKDEEDLSDIEIIERAEKYLQVKIRVTQLGKQYDLYPSSENDLLLVICQLDDRSNPNHYNVIMNFRSYQNILKPLYKDYRYCYKHQNLYNSKSQCQQCASDGDVERKQYCAFCNYTHVRPENHIHYKCKECKASIHYTPDRMCLIQHNMKCKNFKICEHCNKLHNITRKCIAKLENDNLYFQEGKLHTKQKSFVTWDIESLFENVSEALQDKYSMQHIPFLVTWNIIVYDKETNTYIQKDHIYDNNLRLAPQGGKGNYIISTDDLLIKFIGHMQLIPKEFKVKDFYAHNAAAYDNYLLLAAIVKREEQFNTEQVINNNKLLKLKINGLEFKDSFRIIPSPLAKLNKELALGLEVGKQPQSYTFLTRQIFDLYVQNGGKLRTIKELANEDILQHKHFDKLSLQEFDQYVIEYGHFDFVDQYINYCIQDSFILSKAIEKQISVSLKEQGVNIINYLTAPSMAMNLFTYNCNSKIQIGYQDLKHNKSKCEYHLAYMVQNDMQMINKLLGTSFTKITDLLYNQQFYETRYNIDIVFNATSENQQDTKKYRIELDGVFYHGLKELPKEDKYYNLMKQRKEHHENKNVVLQLFMEEDGYESIFHVTDVNFVKFEEDNNIKIALPPKYEIDNRQILAGGRTEIFNYYELIDKSTERMYAIDFTSLYPSCMVFGNLPLRDLIVGTQSGSSTDDSKKIDSKDIQKHKFKFNSLFGLSILSHENNYSNIQLLTAGTDMSIINFIRQQQTIYQASNSSTGLLYTLCNLIGGAQLHPTIITSKFYKNISINNQSNQQMMMQIDTYEIYFNLLNIYCSVLPELQGEVQFLCPLISPQLIFQYGEQNDNYCFNYAKQFNYLLNFQQMSQFQLQNYQQLFNGMKIQKQSQDIDQQISLSQQILIENQVQYKLLLSSDLNQFYKKLKVLSSTYINRDVFAILGYNITKWFFKQISKLISIENQIDLLNVFLKPQQISEITSCFLFFSNLTKNKLDEMTNFLNQLNYSNQYLSFFTQKGYNDQVGTWDQLQKQAENCEFILQNQSFDTFVAQKGNKADFIKHSLKGAAYTYHRLSELLPEKIKKMAIMVKIDFPHVSNYLLTADISLPDYVLFLFGFQSDFNSQFFSEVNYLYEKQLFTSYICGFESGNHTPQKLFQKINGSLLDTVIQCSVTNSINNDQDTNLYISLYEQTSFMLEQQQQNVIQNQQQEKVHDAIKKETQQYKQINNYPYLFQLPITENCPKNDLNDNLNNINNYNKSEQFNYLKQFIDNYCSQKSILSASFGYGHDLLQNIFKYDLAIKKCIKNEIGDCQYDYQKDSNLTPLEYYVVELLHILVD